MSPEEQQLITGLFDRMKPAANQQRDRDAERLIGEQVRTQPYAPYLLAQTVIVQDQALRAANDKIQALEEQVRQHAGGAAPEQTSFLGGLGRSIFGGDQTRGGVPAAGRAPGPQDNRGQSYAPQAQQGGPQQGGPWGQAASAAGGLFGGGGGGGGGFMKGALGAAAGVAGGVLLADGIRGLFSGGHNPYGLASGFGGGAEGFGNPGGETIINNYYDDPGQGSFDGGDAGGGDVGGGGDNIDSGSYGGGYSSDV